PLVIEGAVACYNTLRALAARGWGALRARERAMRDIDEHARERALAQLVAVGRDGYSRFGRGVILVEAAHQRAVRYLARAVFEAELVERFALTLDHDADTRRLAELLDTYDPDTQCSLSRSATRAD